MVSYQNSKRLRLKSVIILMTAFMLVSGCGKEETPETRAQFYRETAQEYLLEIDVFDEMVNEMTVVPQEFTKSVQKRYQRQNEKMRSLMLKMDRLVEKMQTEIDNGMLDVAVRDEISAQFEEGKTHILTLRNAMNIMLGLSVSSEEVQQRQQTSGYWFQE